MDTTLLLYPQDLKTVDFGCDRGNYSVVVSCLGKTIAKGKVVLSINAVGIADTEAYYNRELKPLKYFFSRALLLAATILLIIGVLIWLLTKSTVVKNNY